VGKKEGGKCVRGRYRVRCDRGREERECEGKGGIESENNLYR
jgi:hypothetical protein